MLLIDLYTAVVLEATGRDSIPQSDWDDVRLYIPETPPPNPVKAVPWMLHAKGKPQPL